MSNKILLVDGNILMFKSFFGTLYTSALPLQNSEGVHTHAIQAFFNTLIKVINDLNPTHIYIAFDASSRTKRHEKYEDYKAGREKAPQELFDQMKLVKEILDKSGILWQDKFLDEADDLIATLATKFNNGENEIVVFSADQDLLQLIDEKISIWTKDKDNTYFAKTKQNFFLYHFMKPSQIPDYKGLAGDASDNLKGVPGIGPKGAVNLLMKYRNLEGIYNNLKEISPGTRKKLEEERENAFLCRELATLNREVDMSDVDLERIKLKINYTEELDEILSKLELRQISKKLKEII